MKLSETIFLLHGNPQVRTPPN